MSASKYKYYTVTITNVIRANNQRDAVDASYGKRGVDASLLSTEVDAFRISAGEAKSVSA